MKFNNLFLILFISILTISCGKSESENRIVINKIEQFNKENNRFPTNLEEIDIYDNEYCYYITGSSFNLEYTVGNDLHWYNSGNYSWDLLEGDADKFKCKEK